MFSERCFNAQLGTQSHGKPFLSMNASVQCGNSSLFPGFVFEFEDKTQVLNSSQSRKAKYFTAFCASSLIMTVMSVIHQE